VLRLLRRLTPRQRWIAVALALIVLVGGGLRFREAVDPDPRLSADEQAYVNEALNLSHGTYGDFRWPPGAPVMFAASRVFDKDRDLPAAYWFQALVCTLTILAAFGIAAVAAGPVAGLLASGLVAFYQPFWILSGSLQSEPLGALLLALAMLAVVWALKRDGRLRWWALAGALFGLTILTRTDLILAPGIVAAIACLSLWRRERDTRSALLPAGVLLGAYVLCLSPWIIFASSQTGHFTPVTEGDAPALFVGTYLPGHGTTGGMKAVLGDRVRAANPRLRNVKNYNLPAAAVLNYVAKTERPGMKRDDALRAEAKENLRHYATTEPVKFAKMMGAKVKRTWLLSSRAGSPEKSDFTRAYHVWLVCICVALMLAALLWLRRSALVAMCLALIAYSVVLHAVFVAKPRYNLPLMALLMVGGVVAAFLLLERIGTLRSRGVQSRSR
jgi:4-amino-4-deoxy-L-arabinose transferase-like glycosyltransferase